MKSTHALTHRFYLALGLLAFGAALSALAPLEGLGSDPGGIRQVLETEAGEALKACREPIDSYMPGMFK